MFWDQLSALLTTSTVASLEFTSPLMRGGDGAALVARGGGGGGGGRTDRDLITLYAAYLPVEDKQRTLYPWVRSDRSPCILPTIVDIFRCKIAFNTHRQRI